MLSAEAPCSASLMTLNFTFARPMASLRCVLPHAWVTQTSESTDAALRVCGLPSSVVECFGSVCVLQSKPLKLTDSQARF